ncbi:MAG: hypothetical protein NTV34_12870, partial [Proteobacteria bacterium]|nr:hypothetical protein [Pseudomonadota bacterium]
MLGNHRNVAVISKFGAVLLFVFASIFASVRVEAQSNLESSKANAPVAVASANSGADSALSVQAEEISSPGVFARAWHAGFVVFMTLLLLISASIFCWVVIVVKWLELRKIGGSTEAFVKSFWDSRSLNDLNGRLGEYPYSPAREVFRSGYA